MSAEDHLGVYAEGRTKGDADTILRAAADGYVFDDPKAGKITKSRFAEYLDDLKESVRSARGGTSSKRFMELSEVVTQEKDGVLTAWCWWAISGSEIKGSGLINVGAEGVR